MIQGYGAGVDAVTFTKSFDACVGHGDYPGAYGPAKLFLKEINSVADMEKFLKSNPGISEQTKSEMVAAVEKKFGTKINW